MEHSKLEQIFKIENEKVRIRELVDYARVLKINFLKAKKEDGTYSENELAVLIFNAENAKRNIHILNTLFALAVIVIIILFTALVYFLIKNNFMPSNPLPSP